MSLARVAGQNRLDTSHPICEPPTGIDPVTSFLPRTRSTTELGGQRENTLPAVLQEAKSGVRPPFEGVEITCGLPCLCAENGPVAGSKRTLTGPNPRKNPALSGPGTPHDEMPHRPPFPGRTAAAARKRGRRIVSNVRPLFVGTGSRRGVGEPVQGTGRIILSGNVACYHLPLLLKLCPPSWRGRRSPPPWPVWPWARSAPKPRSAPRSRSPR